MDYPHPQLLAELARTIDEQIARESRQPTVQARRELTAARAARRRRRLF